MSPRVYTAVFLGSISILSLVQTYTWTVRSRHRSQRGPVLLLPLPLPPPPPQAGCVTAGCDILGSVLTCSDPAFPRAAAMLHGVGHAQCCGGRWLHLFP